MTGALTQAPRHWQAPRMAKGRTASKDAAIDAASGAEDSSDYLAGWLLVGVLQTHPSPSEQPTLSVGDELTLTVQRKDKSWVISTGPQHTASSSDRCARRYRARAPALPSHSTGAAARPARLPCGAYSSQFRRVWQRTRALQPPCKQKPVVEVRQAKREVPSLRHTGCVRACLCSDDSDSSSGSASDSPQQGSTFKAAGEYSQGVLNALARLVRNISIAAGVFAVHSVRRQRLVQGMGSKECWRTCTRVRRL